eukprot:TRINITY_DN11473_c0_g1_i3.p1 TRINITY_DN11473_c0_g1~~TRINITY_DN11473_c0_g1_i3.p1  ORF type:complete len:296 (-),score=33.75 TRINITY_DN11473_c0_g1_i3:71-958(-)
MVWKMSALLVFGSLAISLLFGQVRATNNHAETNQQALASAGSAKSEDLRGLIQQYAQTFGINLTSITVASKGDAILRFMHGRYTTLILSLLAETGSFVVKNERLTLMEISPGAEIFQIGADIFSARSVRFHGDLFFDRVEQWKLVAHELFHLEPIGWSMSQITTCGGVYLLGGYCVLSGGEVTKTFSDLPAHKMVRITATYHFIDAWTGETGFMRANVGRERQMEYIWTEKYDASKSKNSINVCGNHYGEGKFAVPIDVTIPHIESSITIGFGSTLDQDPCDESFGISNVQIYIR